MLLTNEEKNGNYISRLGSSAASVVCIYSLSRLISDSQQLQILELGIDLNIDVKTITRTRIINGWHLDFREVTVFRSVRKCSGEDKEGKEIQIKVQKILEDLPIASIVVYCHMYPGRVKFLFLHIHFSKNIYYRVIQSYLSTRA